MNERIFQDVLILNDENPRTRMLLEQLAARGLRGTVVRDKAAAGERLQRGLWALFLADLALADGDDMRFLRGLREERPELPVVVFSETDSARDAMRAVRAGCLDYLVKPVAGERLGELLDSLLPHHDVPDAASPDAGCGSRIVGRSDRFLAALRLAKKAAPTGAPVLITGESGTGKELIAHYVHQQSRRVGGPYVCLNCAALSDSLLESELFGHERGAFTGALARRKGKFEQAHLGTLLLDEISETHSRFQAELLRVLEQQDFERVGGSESVRVNVRVVSTSNREMDTETREGRFRQDLYYRICGIHVRVPALRERPEDVPVLAWHFINQYAAEARRQIESIDEQTMELFVRHSWPGNVRQLRNVVRAALILGEGPSLSLRDVPRSCQDVAATRADHASTLSLSDLERQAVLEALERTNSHQVKAAKLLGISDRTLREKIRKYRQEGHLETTGERKCQANPA